jgi:hypothetical protein
VTFYIPSTKVLSCALGAPAARLDVVLGEVHHDVAELVVDALVQVDALGQHADLPRVEEGHRCDLRQTLGDVDAHCCPGGHSLPQLRPRGTLRQDLH